MNYFPLKAATTAGEMLVFSVEDCPKLLDNELFYLANKPGTALLWKNTICRGSDAFSSDDRLFEGDILRDMDGGDLFIVQYYNGFKLRDRNGCIQQLNRLHRFIHFGNWMIRHDEVMLPQWLHRYFQTPKYSKARYMDFSKGISFNLFDIIIASEDNALVYKEGGTVVSLHNIGQFSGIKHPYGKGYYYGQHVKGFGNVTIREGITGIMTANGFRSLGDAEFRRKLDIA